MSATSDGKLITCDGVDVIAVEGGLVARKDTYLDWAAIQQQLGEPVSAVSARLTRSGRNRGDYSAKDRAGSGHHSRTLVQASADGSGVSATFGDRASENKPGVSSFELYALAD